MNEIDFLFKALRERLDIAERAYKEEGSRASPEVKDMERCFERLIEAFNAHYLIWFGESRV